MPLYSRHCVINYTEGLSVPNLHVISYKLASLTVHLSKQSKVGNLFPMGGYNAPNFSTLGKKLILVRNINFLLLTSNYIIKSYFPFSKFTYFKKQF